MKVEKDLREADGVQDERRNGKTGGNSARSFAVLTLCAVLAMVISLGTRTFAESEGGRVYAASDGGEGSPYEEVAVPTGIAGVSFRSYGYTIIRKHGYKDRKLL